LVFEVQTAQINTRREAEIMRVQQMATAQKHQVDQRRQMMDHQINQRAVQMSSYSSQRDILTKSLKDMPLGSYVPPALGGYGAYGGFARPF